MSLLSKAIMMCGFGKGIIFKWCLVFLVWDELAFTPASLYFSLATLHGELTCRYPAHYDSSVYWHDTMLLDIAACSPSLCKHYLDHKPTSSTMETSQIPARKYSNLKS